MVSFTVLKCSLAPSWPQVSPPPLHHPFFVFFLCLQAIHLVYSNCFEQTDCNCSRDCNYIEKTFYQNDQKNVKRSLWILEDRTYQTNLSKVTWYDHVLSDRKVTCQLIMRPNTKWSSFAAKMIVSSWARVLLLTYTFIFLSFWVNFITRWLFVPKLTIFGISFQ